MKYTVITFFALFVLSFETLAARADKVEEFTVKCPILTINDLRDISQNSIIKKGKYGWMVWTAPYNASREPQKTGRSDDYWNAKNLQEEDLQYRFTGGVLSQNVFMPMCYGELVRKDGSYLKVEARLFSEDVAIGCKKQIDDRTFGCVSAE